MRLRSIAAAGVVASAVLAAAAPPTQAAAPADTTIAWTGDNAGWAALPGVQAVEARFSELLSGPISATWSATDPEGDVFTVYTGVIDRGGVTRLRRATSVTYTSATEQCRRKTSKRFPGTITADRRATFTCRPRPADAKDERALIATTRPTVAIHTPPDGTTGIVAADAGALSPTPTTLTGLVYWTPDTSRPAKDVMSYSLGKRDVRVDWDVCADDGYSCFQERLQMSSAGVPKLPAMSSLKRR